MLNYRYKNGKYWDRTSATFKAGYGLANRRITSLPTSQFIATPFEVYPWQTGHMTHQVEYSSF